MLQPSGEWLVETGAWVFVRIAQGEACWMDGRTALLLGPSDVLIVPPSLRGTLRASQLTTLTTVCFQFRPDLLPGFLTMTERMRAELAAARPVGARVFRANEEVAREFKTICDRPSDVDGAVARSRLLQLAVAVLVQPMIGARTADAVFHSAGKRVERLLQRISEAELLGFSARDLAAHCGCSARHFDKLFRGFFGSSLRAKQRELKLMKARQLLAESDMLVREVLLALGFEEQGGFSMAFKKRFGMTPTEWRRRNRESVKNGQALPRRERPS